MIKENGVLMNVSCCIENKDLGILSNKLKSPSIDEFLTHLVYQYSPKM